MFTFRGHTHYVLLAVQVDGDAVQDISWRGLRSSGGGLKIKEQIEGGRSFLPHRGLETAEWRWFQ